MYIKVNDSLAVPHILHMHPVKKQLSLTSLAMIQHRPVNTQPCPDSPAGQKANDCSPIGDDVEESWCLE